MKTKTKTVPAVTFIGVREGVCFKRAWKQYFIIRDASVTVLHMVPAYLAGWNVERVELQGEESWLTMRAEDIRAFGAYGDGSTRFLDGAEAEAILALEARKRAA